jgi:hypothetical protein
VSAIQDYLNGLSDEEKRSTVAGPSGMRDAAAGQQGAMADYLGGLGGSISAQQQMTGAGQPTQMTGTFRSWYTGANQEGTKGGWDTDFQRVFQKGVQEAYEKGDPYGYFANERATGVVTWDNAKGVGDVKFGFGDVVVDGKRVANVYEDFDRHTANVMMGEYLVETGARKGELNNASDITRAWEDELTTLRAAANQQAEVYPRAKQFEAGVAAELETDADRAGIVVGGGVGGATLGGGIGASIGSVVPGVGTLAGGFIGGGIGFGVGALGAWLNSDSLAYQLARSQEQVKLAERDSVGANLQANLSMVAQNTMSIGLSPLSNLLQGTYDVAEGRGPTGGALGGAFYETDEVGDRKAGAAIQAADFGAMIGDSALQFASPAGRLAFQAQMSTQIASGVVGLLPGVGMWDPTTLQQNSVWTRTQVDPETGRTTEEFDLGNSLAGIGTVGIDVVQLGAISSLSRGVDRLAAQTAARSGEAPSVLAKSFRGENFLTRANLSGEQRAALRAGAEVETRSGYKFVIDEAGEIVGKPRATLAMMAPSEGLQALSAKMLARRDAARRSGAVAAEDLYQAASSLALGQRGLTAMLVNAVGEGQEEVLQSVLEPWSQDHKVDAEQVLRAGLAGAAAGFGMTAGARLGRPSADLQMFTLGQAAYADQTNGAALSYQDWQGMDNLAKRTLVKSASGLAKSLTDGAFDKIETDRIAGTVGGVVEAAAYEDYLRDETEAALKTGASATDQAAPIVMHESATFRPEAIATSHTQLLVNQQDRTTGATLQLDELGKEIARTKSAAAADPGNADLAEQVARLEQMRTSLSAVQDASKTLERTIALHVADIDAAFAAGSPGDAEAVVDTLNVMLEDMFDMTANTYVLVDRDGLEKSLTLSDEQVMAFSKAASRLATRDPADSTASWQVLLPQVNKVWSQRGADGLYGVSQVILTAIRGDYDGDKMRELQQLVIDDKSFVDLRSGANILGAGAMPEIGSTKFEKLLSTRVMQSWRSTNAPIRAAARAVSANIEADLKARYGGVIGDDVLDAVTTEVAKALRTGKDVRRTVLETMSVRAGGLLNEIGRGLHWTPGRPKLSNEMYWMANAVTKRMQEFQSAWAEHTPTNGDLPPRNVEVAPSQATTDTRSGRARRGATDGSTIIQELPGSQIFRMFQKLHYTGWETTERNIGFALKDARPEYLALVQHYEALSQGVMDQRLSRQSPSDQIIGQVLAWLEDAASDPDVLERLGITEMGEAAIIANAGVPQVVYARDDDGNMRLKYTGKEVSYGQHLLYLSLQKFQRANRMVWDKDADLKAAYNNLFALTKPQTQGDETSYPGNAEMAFVRIFEGVRLYDMVGTDAVSLGVNRTIGQIYRQLVSTSPAERKEQKYSLREGVYRDSAKGFTIPFGSKELKADSVTAYKSVVDSLFSAADSTLSIQATGKDKGKVVGRDAKKSEQRGKLIRGTYKDVRALLRLLAPKTGEYTAAEMSAIVNANPEFGEVLLKTIPTKAMPHVFKGTDEVGRPIFASWFYEVWTQPSAEAAEMSYFRNVTLETWYSKVRNLDIDFARGGENATLKKIAFDSLDSRMHRVLFRLASASAGNQLPLQNFLTKLNEAKSVEQFMAWVNTEEGLVTDGAPLLAWMDDVALYDPERAGGGWTSKLSTPTLMEHITDLRTTARRMIGDLAKADERAESDVNTALAIQRWFNHLQNPNDPRIPADPDDRNTYLQFVELLRASAKRRMANGPRAMLQHTAHLVHGMYAPAHAKGEIAEQMAANAALEAADNAFGFLVTAERVLGDLTAHNVESVSRSPQMILRDGGRMMDHDGSPVQWELNSVEAMLPLMTDPANHSLMRSVLFDTVIELDTDNVARRKHLMGSTLEEVLRGNTVADLFPDEGNPGLTASMKFLVKLEAELRDTQKHSIEQKVTELVLARTTALDHTASFEEIQSMTVQAYLDMAALLQVVGRTNVLPGEEDPVVEAHRVLKEASMVAAIAAAYKIDPKVVDGNLSNMQDLIEQEMLKPSTDRITALVDQLTQPGWTATQRGDLEAALKAEQSVLAAMQAKITRMFDLNVTQEIVNTYLYTEDMDDASKSARQGDLMAYVYDHGELMQAAGPALITVQMIKNHFGDTPRQRKVKPLQLTEEAWAELSSVIISVEIQHLLTVSPASKPPPPYPAALKPGTNGLDKRKYWDHSFSYLFDFLAEDDTTGIVAAARQLAVDGGKVQSQFGADEVVQKVKNSLLREGSLGAWGPEIPMQSIESYELLTGASAKPSISMHGLLSLRWGATMMATQRQTTDTVADATVTLTAHDLNWMTNGQFHDVEVTAGNGSTYQRPLALMNNRFAEELTVAFVDPAGDPQTLDLMTRPNVARTWIPATATAPVPASRFKEVNITRLDEELELALKQQYPDVMPDELSSMLHSVQVTMRFVNPDAQPATVEHANSVWHEGTVYYSDGDLGDSLVTAFFYGVGGLNPRGQQAALDTRKLGLSGIEDYSRPAFESVLEMERLAPTDFARMLALKTNVLMDTAISDGKPIDVHFYNAAYKLMKLKHWVDGVDRTTNERVRWSAEQVIAWQMANPGIDFYEMGPLTEAVLWIPSDQVLADMMGDIGFGGVTGRMLKQGVTDDLTTIPRYESRWTAEMERKFPVEDTSPKSLTDTEVARQAFVQDLRVSSFLTPQERTRFQRRQEVMELKRGAALEERTRVDAQRRTFSPKKNLEKNMAQAVGWVRDADVNLVMPAQLAYLTQEQRNVTTKTIAALESYTAEQQSRSGTLGTSFWIFQESGQSSPDEGRLTKGDLGGRLNIVPGEVVFFDTAPYQDMDPTEARNLALKRIDFFVSKGASLMIGSSDGSNPLTAELQRLTQSQHRYLRYENNNNILQPDVFDQSDFQNVSAAKSRLVVPSGVPIARQRLTMLVLDQEVEENTIWAVDRPGRKSKFETFQAVFDLFPVDVHSQFNTANTSDDAEKVLRRLEGLGDEGVAMLRTEALRHLYEENGTSLRKGVTQEQADAEETEFNRAWRDLMRVLPTRVAKNTTQPRVGESFGTGDIVPLVNSLTGEILLYRHGYDYPSPQDFARQLTHQTPATSGERGIVMYSGERASSATTHRGNVVRIEASPGRGYRMELDIPVQSLGSKIVFEHNGMKYLKTNLPANVQVPSLPLFGDIHIEGIASLHDTISKEATDGLVTSFQNLFATFGIDFRQDIKTFFGTQSTDEAISMLRKIQRLGNKQSVDDVYQLQSLLAGNDAYLSAITGLLPQLQQANVDTSGWAGRLQDPTPEAFIARAMIVYLTSPGADLDAILSSSGFYVDNPALAGAESQKMPELFTRAFDLSAPDSQIRAEIGRRIDAKLNKSSTQGWHLDLNTWELEGRVPGGRTLRGLLQYGEAHVSEDNVLLNLMAQERKDSQSATRHQGLMNMIGTGGFLRTKGKRLDRLDAQRQQNLPETAEPGSLWRDLTFVDPSTAGPGSRWQNRTPAEHRFYNLSQMRFAQYRHAIDMTDAVFEQDRDEIKTAVTVIANRLGLRKSQHELVHYWIRQMLHHPAEGADQAAFSDDLSPKDVLGAARTILGNIEDGYLPTYDSVGPSFFSFPDLQILFQANQRDAKAWAPSRIEGNRSVVARRDDLGEWISIAFGQAINEKTDFDPIYRLDMAGFMNTYQTVLRNSGYLMDITFDKALQGKLLDPKTNELLSVTMDPTENTRLTEQQIMAISNLEYDDLLRGASSSDDPNSRAQAAAWRARRLKKRAAWRARHKVRPVKVQSTRDFLRNGTELINRDPDMHSLQRIVIALRHGTAMLNPGLYFMMVPEQGFRMFLSETANALTGQSTMRSVTGAQRGVERLVAGATGGRMNLELVQYSPQQIEQMTRLFKTLGNDGAFTSLIIKDMMWKRNPDSPGRVVNAFERYAALGNKWQDPTWGTSQKALARHYVEAIMRAVNDQPTKYVFSIDNIIAHLQTDPAYFATHHPELHKAASNYVVDFRSLKNTPWSLAMKSLYEPWSQSENMGKRFAGTLLKLQAMYATYNMNVLTTMTGMQGYTDMLSVFLDGRKKPGSLMSLWWKGRNGQEITDEDYRTFDMSSTLDGVTIANAFIKGGVTQTGLFMLGMAAGGALSGEDDEAKRRRRLAQAQNAHLIMDPRRLEADFRNKDSIFLDWLPPQLNAFFRVQGDDGVQGARSMAQVSFLLKPFLSPLMGMERFFMTGDFSYVTHGFLDALSSLPLFNKNKWDDAVRTANELEALAADEQEAATPTSTKNALYLLTSAVGVFESMLVENMFVNGVYAGLDMYDRDPSKMVLRDSDGDPQVTMENNARPNDVALKDYIKEDGTVGQGYQKRDPFTANVAAYTENNFTAAAVMSLFTGFKLDLMRSDMPVTIRKIDLPELKDDEAKIAVILATLNSQAAAGTLERRLSLDEVTAAIKGEAMKTKDWDAYNNVDALAKRFYLSPANPVADPMSFIGKDGQEVLTKSGQAALFKGLLAGTITLDSPEMRGVGITVDERKELEKEFYSDMTRQGVDLGLTLSQAEKRATRLMMGPIDDPGILGFKDILWDKRIPWTADARYKQLNTTYVQGPDGYPWATGYKRGGAPGFGGFASLFGGLKRPTIGVSDSMTEDGRMNSADLVRGINTGLRGLVPFNETENTPTDLEQTQSIIDAIKKSGGSDYQGYVPNSNGGNGYGGGGFYRGYGGGGGGGGGRSYSPTIYWSRQPTLPRGTNVYGNFARNLFWNNANIRRTTIRRERYQASRGRLNQWQ